MATSAKSVDLIARWRMELSRRDFETAPSLHPVERDAAGVMTRLAVWWSPDWSLLRWRSPVMRRGAGRRLGVLGW